MKKRQAKKIILGTTIDHKQSSIDKAFVVLYGDDPVKFRKRLKEFRARWESLEQTNEELAS